MSIALFYKNPRPLDQGRDADLKVRDITDLSFCRNVNTIPVNVSEFAAVARHYPIGFVGDGAVPMAIVGLQRENLFLDAEGHWKAGVYVPAFVRRYPFIFANTGTADQYSLCVDDTPEALSRTEGRPLFEDGQPSALTRQALDFCKSFHQAAQATDPFAKAVLDAGLLVERQADARLAGGASFSLKGFRSVDPERVRKLPAKTLGQWNAKNWLAPLYAHLQSMTNWNNLVELMAPAKAA